MQMSSGNIELLAKGTLVEVTSDEEGFCGAWFLAKVLDTLPKKMEYFVEYQSLPFIDSNDLLRKLVPSKFVRPLPPLPSSSEGQQRFQVNDVVEAYHNDGWWVGVVSKVSEEEQPGIYSVSFENPCHVLEFESSQLRLHLDWDGHKWVQPQKLEKPCNICGNVGSKDALLTCSKCCEACEHVYCMRVFTKAIPKSWVCEECLVSPISVQGDQFLNPNSRLLESSQVLKVVQSMEEFQLMPQKPHFRPLDECEEVHREGLMLACMMTFVNVVKETSKLQADSSGSKMHSLLKCLPELESHGFVVKDVRSRLLKLQSMKRTQKELQIKLKKAECEITKRTCTGRKMKDELDHAMKEIKVAEETIKVAEEKIRVAEEKRTRLTLMNEENDSVIAKLESSVDLLNEDIQIVEHNFASLAVAPLKVTDL